MEEESPTNFVLRDARGREVDVHVMEFTGSEGGVFRMADGTEWVLPEGSFAGRGTIGDRPVRCLSADTQMLDHSEGYEPGETDNHDMHLLHERLGTALLPP